MHKNCNAESESRVFGIVIVKNKKINKNVLLRQKTLLPLLLLRVKENLPSCQILKMGGHGERRDERLRRRLNKTKTCLKIN